jgi:hypothetical protein
MKSWKPKNSNYIDSSGVIHEKQVLKDYLDKNKVSCSTVTFGRGSYGNQGFSANTYENLYLNTMSGTNDYVYVSNGRITVSELVKYFTINIAISFTNNVIRNTYLNYGGHVFNLQTKSEYSWCQCVQFIGAGYTTQVGLGLYPQAYTEWSNDTYWNEITVTYFY